LSEVPRPIVDAQANRSAITFPAGCRKTRILS
jgi:hypothetical protein